MDYPYNLGPYSRKVTNTSADASRLSRPEYAGALATNLHPGVVDGGRLGEGQLMETIKAAEKALKDVFCYHYVFHIPPYQRPYSWTTEQAGDLLDDLIWAAGDNKPAERPPYFLGSIVVIKDPNYPVADVVGNPVFRGTRVPVHMLAELVPSRGASASCTAVGNRKER